MNQFTLNLIRAYDIAGEIDLEQVQKMLVNKNPDKFRLKRFHREMAIQNPPVVINLGVQDYDYNGTTFTISIFGKIWNYGAVSVNFRIPVECANTAELNELVYHFEQDEYFGTTSKAMVNELAAALYPISKEPGVWEENEDYTIVQYISERGCLDLPDSFHFDDIARLVEGQKEATLSSQTLEQIKNSLFQYSDEDLIVVDWNRAIIMGDNEEVEELSDIVEFALCQLLEMRLYDDLLDTKIGSLYKAIQTQKSGFFNNRYAALAHEASLLFIELSEVIDLVENSLKVIGDTYYAKVYRVAIARFHIQTWRQSISHKLDNLSNISSLFNSEINERRNQLMELIIVILITIEVIPFLWNLAK